MIGGKKLSRGRRFVDLVRGATPDLVLTGVELLADHLGSDLVVVDIGGATTDVYSVLTPDPEQRTGPRGRGRRHAVAQPYGRGRPRHALERDRRGRGRRVGRWRTPMAT